MGRPDLLRASIPTVCLFLAGAPDLATAGPGRDAPITAAPAVRLETLARHQGGYMAQLSDGGEALLTLHPQLQDTADEVFRVFQVPYGAAVVVSVPDGRVLALAGRSAVEPTLGAADLALRPWAPAASVFKVVSAAALVTEAGLTARTKACYHGGLSVVLPEHLVDNPALDRRCDTLAYGIGKSQNALLAKLAARHLTPEALKRVARSFAFGERIPFDVPVEPSTVDVPDDPLEFARTAAGFWHSTLSPLHGALLAAAIANRGLMPHPRLVERAVTASGRPLPEPRSAARRVLDPAAAREVGRMMELTTRTGTARSGFRDRAGRRYLPVEVAGKTGSLSGRGILIAGPHDRAATAGPRPAARATAEGAGRYVGYSWFVGYAPADRPQIAFAVAIGNHSAWRIKATYVARRLIAQHLAGQGDRVAARMLAAR